MAIRNSGVRYDVIARDSASRVFRGIGDSAGRLDSRIGRLGRTVAYAGAALAGGLAAGVAVSVDQAVKFEAEMKKVQTQAGASARDVAVLSKQVLELGKTTQQGPQQLAEALYHLKSVGMDNVDAMRSLKVASDLAAVGGSGLEDTTNALAGAWRSGIKGAETFQKAASTVNAVLGAGNMRMQDFVEAIGTGILPSAKSFGLSLNSVGAALALMTDEGVPAVDAATRLRMSFSLLGATTPAADKQLKKIGLTGLDLAHAMRGPQGLIGAISLLKDHLDKSGLSAERQSQLLSRAFGGGKSDSAILTMLNNLDVLRKKQDQVNSSMGKFPAAVQAQRKTVAAQLALLKSNLDVGAIELGTKLLPPVSQFVQYLNKTALPAMWKVSGALESMVPVGKIKSGFATVNGLVSDFIHGFETAPKRTTLTLPTPTLKVPSTPIPDGLRKPLEVPAPTLKVATTPIPMGVKAPAAVKSQAQQLGEQLRGLISNGIGDAVGKLDWGKLGKQIGNGLGKGIDWVGAHGSDLTKKLAKAIGGVDWVGVGKAIGVFAVPFAIGVVDNLFAPLFTVSFWQKHWLDTIIAVISVLPVDQVFGAAGKLFGRLPWGKLGELLDHVPWGRIFNWSRWITDPLGGALTAADRFVSMLADAFRQGFARRFPAVAAWFGRELELLPLRLGVLALRLASKGETLLKGFGEKLTGSIPGWSNRFIRGVLKFFGRYTLYQSGVQLVMGLLSGIGSGMAGIGRWINSHIVDPVVNWTKSLFGIHSPSTVFAGIGRDLIRGLTGGVAAGAAGIGKWLWAHVVDPILGAFGGAGGWLYGRGAAVVSGLRSGILGGAGKLGSWVYGHIGAPIIGAFGGAAGWLYGIGTSLMSGLLQGVKNGFHDITKYLGTVKSTISGTLTNITGSIGGIVGRIPGLATGGLAPIGQTAWVGERGPELMQVTPRGTRIFNNRDSMKLAGLTGLQVPGYASGTVSTAQARVDQAHADVDRAKRRRIGLKAAQTRLKAAETELANARRATKLTVSNALQNGFLKSLETGTAAGIASAIKAMNTKLQNAGAGSLVAGNLRTSAQLQSLATRKASIASQIAAAQKYATDQASGLGDFLSVTGTDATNAQGLIQQMRAGQSTASRFASEVGRLSKAGLSKTLLSQLAEAGPGSQLAAALANATPDNIKYLNQAAAAQNKLTTSFGRSMADSMYDSGKDAGRGFLTGLQSQEAALQAEMNRLASGMVTTIKMKLGIRSPSTVFRDEVGRQIALGTAVGIRRHTTHVRSAAQRMADTAAAVRARGAGARAGTAPAPGQHVTHVHVHFDDPTLRDLIRVEVDEGLVQLGAAVSAGALL